MMATAVPPGSSSFLPLLESLEDGAAGTSGQTDAYLTIANRLSGDEGRHFLPAVEKHFSRLGKIILAHITSTNVELSQAALQALGFCVYHSNVASGASETLAEEILSALCSLVVKSTDKNTCTRALWVISKQNFPSKIVAAKVPSVLSALESVWSRDDIQSVVMEHEALNVVIRLLEQVPAQMGEGAVRWAKLVLPLVVHSASKVRLRAAAALEMGLSLLLEKQTEVAAIIEPMMSTKLIPELQKLFMTKNETNVLKLWPLFVRLLGKLLHKGGPFINSLLHLEEQGFRSSSPTIKKIAFLAWKSLIDNFALNPDILCSSKRMKLLMQPLSSINVRTEPLLLTKVEVWWYLVVQLGPNLAPNFDVVSVPLLQSTIGCESVSVPGTPSRGGIQNGGHAPGTPKNGGAALNASLATPRMNLNSSVSVSSSFPSIQLLGLEMLLHYFMGPEVVAAAAQNKLKLSLEPLKTPFLSGASSFTKHAAVLITCVRDGLIGIGKDAPEPLLTLLWANLLRFVNVSIESVGSKKDRQGCEVLGLTLQALQSVVLSEALPSKRVLFLIEATVKAIPPRVLASASYQVGKMDVLNGTPALFLIQLLYDSSMLSAYVEDERFVQCLQTLVSCGLSGPASPLAFAEAVMSAIKRSSGTVQNKEQLWKMWSVVVSCLTDTVTHSNEVNQGDALEHNFSAMYSALMFPMTHLLQAPPLQQASQKSLLSTWSKLYKVFARCSALVITAEENICCEELCAKMAAAVDKDALLVPSTLNVVSNILQVLVDSVDFTPYTPHFQQKVKSPHTPVNWMKKRNKVLGNLSTFQSLVVQCLNVFLDECGASSEAPGVALVSVLSTLFSNLVLASAVQELLSTVVQPLTRLYRQTATEPATFSSQFVTKLEKFISEALSSLQSRSTLAFNSELLELLCPLLCVLFSHKNKQLRTTVTHFWNASFANSISLVYPEELRPILSQVKQKTPIILPGFEVVSVPDDLSGQDLSECSQLETKLSGIPISSLGKRDSLLGKTPEAKDRTSSKTSKLVSTKLDFGSPKAPCRSVLEEEASVDFVFIPPETKERVLTEHQKEVKRTKRVDIPAMYNNLDASLDSTAFTQYTQSQDSADMLPSEQKGEVTKEEEASVKTSAPEATDGAGKTTEAVPEETQDFVSPRAEEQKSCDQQDEVVPDSTDVSMEEEVQNEETNKDTNSQANVSPNTSQVASGTPQKSRRQPFITLEQYGDGKPSSPSSVFTGSKVKTSNSQKISPSTPSTADSLNSQSSQTEKPTTSVDTTPESPRLPKDGKELKGVKLTDRLPSDTTEDEDMIPDTQTETQAETPTEKKTQTEMPSDTPTDTPTETAADTPTETPTETAADTPTKEESSSQESQSSKHSEESDVDSQLSQGEPRRSSRQRVRPLLPGEDPGERDEKFAQLKRRRTAEDVKEEVQVKHYTRSKCAEEDGTKDRRRTRSQAEKEESSQTGSGKRRRRFSGSQDFVEKPGRRRSLRETRQSDSESQSEKESRPVGRPPRKSKVTPEKEKDEVKEKTEMAKDEPNSNGSVTSSLQSSPDSQAVVVLKKIDGELQPSPSATPDSSVLSEVKVELEKELEKCPPDCTQAEDANVLDVNQEDAVGDVSEPQVDSQSCSAQNEPQDAETQMQITEPLESPSDPTADGLSEEEETKTTEEPQDQPLEASEGATAIHDISEDNAEVMEGEEKPEDHVVHPSEELKVTETDAEGEACATAEDDALPASPVKQMDPETPAGPEAGQSPSSLTKGTWSPTASPSTSILKKAQKRALEVETPSPLVKSRRVSFADPIQHQELADDIDRRSPALRTSSPRRTRMGIGSIPQPKFVTTPTKGLITLSPRNLNSPGYKSSKKCLISEMGQEPRPVSKDCIYPALVGCTAPVEAVLPRIASTVWSRGFGQIVRARNIKTVGDLSALTPTEVKVLPIRSPKISNVKKALKIYEQQRKGRGGDELKSFDETELMTSEVDETSAAQNQDEDQKTLASDALATELVFDAVSAEKMEQDSSVPAPPAPQTSADPGLVSELEPNHTHPPPDPLTSGDLVPGVDLVTGLELLQSRSSLEALSRCSPQQLLVVHQRLGDMMKAVVLEMHSRLSNSHSQ
ncbi:telomere-associated protein RIF1 isoform X2 [Periophthalmus magnuspinnatus]|uniref:telomere-associated protein RIF1 isoform X2 n=1 Tax=Periophthalmus magnuspinnatus TaxID=409849 RepID=UPI002436E287|nr:telomere-associated protein RIF1 isoform X2 [Periophthalmus magnuspinnatus]